MVKAETFNAEMNIRNAAKGLNDQELLRKIGTYDFGFGPDFPAMEVQYHHQCKKEYFNELSLECCQKEGGSKDKKAKRIAFSDIVTMINDNCIGKNNPMQLTDLLDRYKTVYIDEGGDEIKSQRFNVQNLAKKLRKQFEESELKIQAESTRKILWRGDLTYSSALNIAKQHSQIADNSIWECAMKLRKEILSIQPKPLEEPLNAQKVLAGEVEPPDSLKEFFTTLYGGNSSGLSARKERFVDSSAADVMYACSGGKFLPGKHLSLGLTVKSITGSKNAVTLLNKFGHCASNEKIRRIDIGIESTISQQDTLLPDQFLRDPNLYTALTWDNFDINISTLSGADSMHHTFGICYKNESQTSREMPKRKGTVRKRKIKDITKVLRYEQAQEVEPYRKKPRMPQFQFENVAVHPTHSFIQSASFDTFWTFSFNFLQDVPMWAG